MRITVRLLVLLAPAALLLVGSAFAASWRTSDPPALRIETLAPAAPNPTAPRVAAPAWLHGRITEAIHQPALHVEEPAPVLVGEGVPAEVQVRVTGSGDAGLVLRWWSVVTAAARIDLDGVTLADVVEQARAGRLFAAAEDLALVGALVPEGERIMPLGRDEIAPRLAAEGGSLAILPAEAVSVRVRALALDGADPVRGDGDLTSYPLVTRGAIEEAGEGGRFIPLTALLREALSRPEPPPIRLLFTGDLIPARCVYAQMQRTGDWAAPFRAVAGRLSGADLTIGSLDAAISARGTPIGCRETFQLLAPPSVIEGLTLAGFDVLSVATNHVKDCGAAGPCGNLTFFDTLALLRAAGIAPAGGGENLAEARRPVVREAGGVRFAFLAYDDVGPHVHARERSAGVAALEAAGLAEDIRAARAVADVVIVLPQWGEEYTPHPTRRQRDLARVAVEAGATLVAGNHPHTVQAAAPLDDGYVAYALGNFLFDQDWSVETTEGVVMEAVFRGPRLAAVDFLPVRTVDRLHVRFLDPPDGGAILQRMIDAAARPER